jgi:hypothetical protein
MGAAEKAAGEVEEGVSMLLFRGVAGAGRLRWWGAGRDPRNRPLARGGGQMMQIWRTPTVVGKGGPREGFWMLWRRRRGGRRGGATTSEAMEAMVWEVWGQETRVCAFLRDELPTRRRQQTTSAARARGRAEVLTKV